jgi:Zn-finger nucleic acid-binding protein
MDVGAFKSSEQFFTTTTQLIFRWSCDTMDMKCPNDNGTLVMSERSGIEIDYCPVCRGIWLDRGELDKLIEKNATAGSAPAPQPIATPQVENIQHAPQEYRYKDDYRHDDKSYKKRHKRESFLGDLFDF